MRPALLPILGMGIVSLTFAQDAAQKSDRTKSAIQQHTADLIRKDTEKAISAGQLKIPFAQPEQETAAKEDDSITMAPFIVTEDKPVTVPPPEKPLDKFFRTGTIYEHRGDKITSKLWVKGDKGVMMSFEF